MFFIKIRKEELHRLWFLTKYQGFNDIDSYFDDIPDNQHNTKYVAFYDVHLDSWNKKEIKKSIEKNGGHVTVISSLGPREPRLSKETKTSLIECAVLGTLAFFSVLGGLQIFSPGKVIEALGVGVITAAITFFTELYIELRIRRHRNKN